MCMVFFFFYYLYGLIKKFVYKINYFPLKKLNMAMTWFGLN